MEIVTEATNTGIVEIASKDNQHVKLACSLQEKKYRKEENLIIFEGKTLIEEAIKRKLEIQSIFFEKESNIENIFPNTNINFFKVSQEILEKISSTKTAAPLIAIAKKPEMQDPLKNNNPSETNKSTGEIFLFCENLQDPGNLGSIIRTAYAAGVKAIYLSPDCADIFNPKTIRSSMGAIFCGPIIYQEFATLKENFKSFCSQQETSYEVIATSSYANSSFDEININKMKNFLLLVGNESKGLKEETIKASTINTKIPLLNNIESLNVLSATSIILFDLKNKLN